MYLRKALLSEFNSVKNFYWELIDLIEGRDYTAGWKKGIYPANQFLMESIENGELYVLDGKNTYDACVVVNSSWNEGYEGVPWNIDCRQEEVFVPHALAVFPTVQQKGVGKVVVEDIIEMAKNAGKKAVRLDILTGNIPAERLYTSMGFIHVQTKPMYYEDTGWTDYSMYELTL